MFFNPMDNVVPVSNDLMFTNRRGFWSLTTEPEPVNAQVTGYNIYRGESGNLSRVAEIGNGFVSGTNLLAREDLLDVVQNINPDSSPLVSRLRSGNRSRYIEDNHGMSMCYKHRRIWREGADFKLGRRPRVGPGGACKECCLKAQI